MKRDRAEETEVEKQEEKKQIYKFTKQVETRNNQPKNTGKKTQEDINKQFKTPRKHT